MSESICIPEESQMESERRFSFLKKRMKLPKVSKNKFEQNFAHRGWETCSTGFGIDQLTKKRRKLSDEKIDVEIFCSPTKSYKVLRGRYLEKENSGLSRQKSVNFEIGNIESVFHMHKNKSLGTLNNRSLSVTELSQNFSDRSKSKLLQKSKIKLSKLKNSALFKVKDVEEAFQTEKLLPCYESKKISRISLNITESSQIFDREKWKLLQKSKVKRNKLKSCTLFNAKDVEETFQTEKLIPHCELSTRDSHKHKVSKFIFNTGKESKINESDNFMEKFSDLSELFSPSCDSDSNINFIISESDLQIENLNVYTTVKNCPITEWALQDSPKVAELSPYHKQELKINSKTDHDKACGDGFMVSTNKEMKDSEFIKPSLMKNMKSVIQEQCGCNDKGSSWLQSLNWSEIPVMKDDCSDYNDYVGKKKIQNILIGGIAEQMLKLQKREQSDKVIWYHKISETRKKVVNRFLTLLITSVMHFGEIIVTKCSSVSFTSTFGDGKREISNEASAETMPLQAIQNPPQKTVTSYCDDKLLESEYFIVLFKRSMFSKQHLKTNNIIRLYQPWQNLSVPSIPYPVILCAYFIDVMGRDVKENSRASCSTTSDDGCITFKCLKTETYSIPSTEVVTNNYFLDELSLHNSWGKPTQMSARIQRIWQSRMSCEKLKDVLTIENFLSFSLLLQTQSGHFCELKLVSFSDVLPKFWSELISDGEGKCYIFYDLSVTYKYSQERYPHLFKLLQSFLKRQLKSDKVESLQQIYYQLVPNSMLHMPVEIADDKFPLYCQFEIVPLFSLHKITDPSERFSCIGKIVCQIGESYFISDESLLNFKQVRYIRLTFSVSSNVIRDPVVGLTVLIKEAIFNGDYLLIDEYSNFVILTPSTNHSCVKSHLLRLKKITSLCLSQVLFSLNRHSKVKELVSVGGVITQVDENSAMSWLECNFCHKENLLQDSNLVIYCEDCSCIVPKPILHAKMEVTINYLSIPEAVVNIELSSSTVKNFLKIGDDIYQPQCNIVDVMNKRIDYLPCYVRECRAFDGQKVFHLTEINSF